MTKEYRACPRFFMQLFYKGEGYNNNISSRLRTFNSAFRLKKLDVADALNCPPPQNLFKNLVLVIGKR